MSTEQILKVLKNERECINTESKGKCDYHCKNCQYRNSNKDKLEVYDFLIEAYSITEIHINVSGEESEKLFEIINRNARQGVRLAAIPYPDTGESYPTVTLETDPDEYGRKYFKGICPYTNVKCDKWTCSVCEVEERERKFMEGDTD